MANNRYSVSNKIEILLQRQHAKSSVTFLFKLNCGDASELNDLVSVLYCTVLYCTVLYCTVVKYIICGRNHFV